VADAVNVPVIASGGASTAHHMVDAFKVPELPPPSFFVLLRFSVRSDR
jgi:hypothetical protein